MGEFEESYENVKWQAAFEVTGKIKKEAKEVLAHSKLEDAALEDTLTNLINAVVEKDEEKTEIKFLLFHKRLFAFIKNCEFDVHPIPGLIKKYVVEEAAEKGDFDDVASEMVEAGNLIKYAEQVNQQRKQVQDLYKTFMKRTV